MEGSQQHWATQSLVRPHSTVARMFGVRQILESNTYPALLPALTALTSTVSFRVGIVLPFGSVLDQVVLRLARLEMLTARR